MIKRSWFVVLAGLVVAPGLASALPVPDLPAPVLSLAGSSGSIPVALGMNAAPQVVATYALSPTPSVTITVTGIAGCMNASCRSQYFNATIAYDFAIVGPAAAMVPILVTNTLSVSASLALGGMASPTAELDVGSGYVLLATSGYATESKSATNDSPFSVAANQAIPITLSVSGTAYRSGDTSMAMVDPTITIDPSFAAIDPNYATDYTIVFSPGVGANDVTPTSMPEPASLLVVVAGLMAVGLGRKRPIAG